MFAFFGNIACCPPLWVSDIASSAAIEQQLHHLVMTLTASHHQRRPTVLVPAVVFGPTGQQEPRNLRILTTRVDGTRPLQKTTCLNWHASTCFSAERGQGNELIRSPIGEQKNDSEVS